MTSLSPEIEQEISRHMATGCYESVDDLLKQALDSVTHRELDWEKVRQHILDNLRDGEVIEMTETFWTDALAEAGIQVRHERKA